MAKKSIKYDIPTMVRKINKYTKSTEIPILKECCVQNNWSYRVLSKYRLQHQALDEACERLLMIKEVQLEKLGLMGEINPKMAMFSLRQLGWKNTDTPVNTLTLEIEDLTPLASMLALTPAEVAGEDTSRKLNL